MENLRRETENEEPGVRYKLLEAALELFTRKGYASTAVREVVDAAGVSKPALYYYFVNKEGIYLALMREPFSRMDAFLEEILAGKGEARRRIAELCDRLLGLVLENIGVARLMYAIYYGPPQGAPFFDFDGYHLKLSEGIRRLVEEGVAAGEFASGCVDDMVWAVLGAFNVAMEEQLCDRPPRLDREGLGRVLGVVFRGMAGSRQEVGI